ncbi:hypothetical protein [Glycomyces albidus]|uniref:Uncharacterized protein n=1 Tax=Glycomyces albidus TaxID=2656774 RepID=A0A6L5G1G4_9ACTN|nr:hypothetical protein [Glycomyces albidus]MQM24006.1 hypothetical protein [Glycomyces albidus]
MGWWLAASAVAVAVIGLLQSMAAAWQARRTLLVAARVFVAVNPLGDMVFGPLLDRPRIARGATGWVSVPPFVYFFAALAAAPAVGNTAALTLAHGTGHEASWAEVYPEPWRWIAGAALFALTAAAASSAIAVELHFRDWDAVEAILEASPPWARTLRRAALVSFIPVVALAGWGYASVTGADPAVSALALGAGSLALAWTANRGVWAAYRELSLDLVPPATEAFRAAAARLLRSRAIARVAVWVLAGAVVFLGSALRAVEGQVIGSGPELALAVPVAVLAGTVLKDLAADLGRAAAQRHALPFPGDL